MDSVQLMDSWDSIFFPEDFGLTLFILFFILFYFLLYGLYRVFAIMHWLWKKNVKTVFSTKLHIQQEKINLGYGWDNRLGCKCCHPEFYTVKAFNLFCSDKFSLCDWKTSVSVRKSDNNEYNYLSHSYYRHSVAFTALNSTVTSGTQGFFALRLLILV